MRDLGVLITNVILSDYQHLAHEAQGVSQMKNVTSDSSTWICETKGLCAQVLILL